MNFSLNAANFSRYLSPQNTKLNQKRTNISFGESQVNIFATSDNHGKFDLLPAMYSNIVNNADEIFPKNAQSPKSNINIGVFNGDWFMDPTKGGYITHPEKKAGDFQCQALDLLIQSIKKIVPDFKVFFNLGNHDLDGGDRLLIDYLKRLNLTTILSNTRIESSSVIKDLAPDDQSKFVEQVILDIPDDKNPELVNKVLLLSVVISGLEFYVPGNTEGLDVIDKNRKKDAQLTREDLTETFKHLSKLIKEFKEMYPKGLVVMQDHTSLRITEMISSSIDIAPDIVIDGHDHKDETNVLKIRDEQGNYVKSVPVFSLWDNNKKFDSIKLHFDDNGNFDRFTRKSFYSSNAEEIENNPFDAFIKESFKKDRKPLLYIEGPEELKALSEKNIRKENNLLANLVNDGVLDSIRDTVIGRGTQIFGIASSAFRSGLPVNDNITNLQLMSLLNGQHEAISQVEVATVKGNDIISLVIENIENHKKNMDRNTIVQWAGLQINKTELINIIDSKDLDNIERLSNAIKVKNENGKYNPIDLKKTYKIALPNYFYLRRSLPTSIRLKEEGMFKPLSKTIDQLFRQYLKKNDYILTTPNPEDVRILI